jgi:ribulose-bisphosphate carboxylase large chain
VLSHGAEAVMVAPSLMGFDVVDDVRHHADVIVFAHSTFTLSFARVRNFGISLPLWVRLQRLLGADCILLPSHGGSFGVAALDTRQCVRECLDTHGFDGIQPTMPAHSGSMNAHTFELMEHLSDGDDFMFTSGSGLFDHPDGPEAGARELRQVIEGGNNGGNVAWLKAWQPHD